MANIYLPGHGSRNASAGIVAAGGGYYSPLQGRVGMTGSSGAPRAAGGGMVGGAYPGYEMDYGTTAAAGGRRQRGAMSPVGGSIGSVGMGVGGGGANVGGLQGDLNSANAANEARYQQALSGYGSLRNRALAATVDFGKQGAKDINQQYNDAAEGIGQGLVARGLSATTAGIAPRMASERERSGALARLAEQVNREKIGYDMATTRDLLGVVERREDQGPDVGQFLAAQRAAGEASGGALGGLAGAFGGGFGQVGFAGGGPQLGFQGAYGGGGGQAKPNWTKINALNANKGNFAYNSGYSKGGATGTFGKAKPNQIAASQPFINNQLGYYGAYA